MGVWLISFLYLFYIRCADNCTRKVTILDHDCATETTRAKAVYSCTDTVGVILELLRIQGEKKRL